MGNMCNPGANAQTQVFTNGVPIPEDRVWSSSSPDREEQSTFTFGRADSAQAVRTSQSFTSSPEAALTTSKSIIIASAEAPRGDLISRMFTKQVEQTFDNVGDALNHYYREKLLPVERDGDYHRLFSHELPAAYFSSRPIVLTIGQYSTGKTSFIRHLVECDYPGQQIGPEPTTDRFVIVAHGQDIQKIPGNALVYDDSFPFTPLSAFGNTFLSRLECALVPSPILEGVTFVDTPGVLSGEKQRLKRGYDFEEVMGWFIEHSAMIILFFDAHKLDMSDEFKRCITALNSCNQRVQILLNKADRMTTQQLLRVHGALMWALGKVVQTPEVARVYMGSFWDEPLENHELMDLFDAEQNDLYAQIEQLPRSSTVQKMNDLAKRARTARAHAFILEHLRNAMPSVWGIKEKQVELLKALPSVYVEVSRQCAVPLGDFPDLEVMRTKLAECDFTKFKPVDKFKMDKLESMLAKDIPSLLKMVPGEIYD